MDEYVRVASMYGQDVLEFGVGKAYLKVGSDQRCVFQRPSMGRWVCTLQAVKPMACKLFPFRVYSKPVYSRGDNSAYVFGGRTFHVYLDQACQGVVPGKPNERFVNEVLPEVVGIGMGIAHKQRLTTSKYISWKPY